VQTRSGKWSKKQGNIRNPYVGGKSAHYILKCNIRRYLALYNLYVSSSMGPLSRRPRGVFKSVLGHLDDDWADSEGWVSKKQENIHNLYVERKSAHYILKCNIRRCFALDNPYIPI
jgi:hypothetical protein